MDPSRKRKVRLVSLLTVAVLLAGALIYTSFSAATEQRTPSQVLSASGAETYDLGGEVVANSVQRDGEVLTFRVRDPKGEAAVPVRYTGAVPDPFREGREVIVTGAMSGGVFVAQKDSLVTKCPSKFTNEQQPHDS